MQGVRFANVGFHGGISEKNNVLWRGPKRLHDQTRNLGAIFSTPLRAFVCELICAGLGPITLACHARAPRKPGLGTSWRWSVSAANSLGLGGRPNTTRGNGGVELTPPGPRALRRSRRSRSGAKTPRDWDCAPRVRSASVNGPKSAQMKSVF